MRISRVVAAMATVVALTIGLAVPAAAATTGTISVTVSYPGGAKVTTGCLNLRKITGSSATFKDCTPTSGKFSVASLPFGEYEYTVTGVANYLTLRGGAEITSAAPTYSKSRVLVKSGVVSGVVKAAGGTPLAGAKVSLYRRGEAGSTSALLANTTSSATGAYALVSPVEDWVEVVVTGPPSYGTLFLESAFASAGSSSVRNATLEPAGTISGTIAAPPSVTGTTICVVAAPYDRKGFIEAKHCGARGASFSLPVAPGYHSVCVSNATSAPHCTATSTNKTAWFDPHLSIPVSSAANVPVDLRWGGTLEVIVQPDNDAALIGGCLTFSTEAVGSLEDCAPSDGRFHFSVAEDLLGAEVTLSLAGAENVADFSSVTWQSILTGRTELHVLRSRAVGTGSIDIAVDLEGGGAPSSGCAVIAYAAPLGGTVAEDCQLADGSANFVGLPVGTFVVSMNDVPDTLSRVWYPAEPTDVVPHTTVALGAGEHRSLSMTLPTTVSLSGTVVDSVGPRSDGQVQFVANGSVLTQTTPDADGSYSLVVPIGEGSLRVSGFEGAADMYLYNAYAPADSGDIADVDGETFARAGLNFLLRPAAALTGVFEAPGPATDAEVCIFALDSAVGHWGPPQCGNEGDAFALPVVPGKSYHLCSQVASIAGVCEGDRDRSDAVGVDNAPKAFAVPSTGGPVAVDVAFGGTVVVTVSAGGAELSGGCAILGESTSEDSTGELARSCDPVGNTFTIPVDVDTNQSFGVRFEGVRGAIDSEPAYVGPVGAGDTRTLAVNVTPWPKFVGTIARPAGAANTRACVFATDLGDVFEYTCLEPGTSSYTLTVPPGLYVLQFYTEEPDAAWEWYNNAATLDGATWVSVGTGSKTINATLAAQAIIKGHVTTVGGASAQDGCVTAYGADGRQAGIDCAIDAGNYEINSLPAGTYRLKFSGFDSSALGWYATGTTFGTAKAIPLTVGARATANMTLGAPSNLRGVVTFAGAPATGGCVEVLGADGYSVDRTCALSDGSYQFTELPAGVFDVFFEGFSGAADVYYGGVAVREDATKVSVSRGVAKVANIALGRGGSLSGAAYQSDFGEGGFTAELYDAHGRFVTSTELVSHVTDDEASYTYSFSHLPAGTYKVAIVRDHDGHFAWRLASGSIAPDRIAVPTGTTWAITGKTLPNLSVIDGGTVHGTLNVPSTWTSSVVCAVAVTTGGTAVASDCGPKGSAFALSRLGSYADHAIVFTNGEVRTSAAYKSFKGTTRWFGNATSRSTAPYYWLDYAERAAFPVWFFKDVTYKTPGFWEISWMGDEGISTGYPDGSYKPDAKVIRKDMARFLYRLAGSPAVTLPSKSPFKDVATSDAAYPAIVWLGKEGITTANPFKPKDPVTRRQMVMFLYRMAGEPSVSLPSRSPFKDVKTTDTGYKAIVWAKKAGVTTGYSDGRFRPGDAVIRGHMAKFMFRFEPPA